MSRHGTRVGRRSIALNQLGEFGLLQRLFRRIPFPSRTVLIGPGDDAAVLRASTDRDWVVTTDMLVEAVDFNRAYSSFRQIGYKALAVNLSDIAAMGGRPVAFLVGLAAPGRTLVRVVDEIYRGMLTLARRYDVALIGGDVSAARRGITISVMVLGTVEHGNAVTRSGAKSGDRIYVTGTLGDSRAGLEILKKRRRLKPSAMNPYLVHRHFSPTPRIEFGRLLSRRRWATAMIDLSDGLASDLRHLCEASRVGARLEWNRFPVSPALAAYARRLNRSAADYALRGGEDFELLFTVNRARVAEVEGAAKRMALAVTPIGTVVSKGLGITLIGKESREIPLTVRGYEHFTHS